MKYSPCRVLSFLPLLALLLGAPAQAYLALVRQGVESADVPNTDDLFGYTLATGDFDNDGRDDLAVAAIGESNSLINTATHGLVTVNFGTVYGLEHLGTAVLSPGAPADNSIKFGYAMAVGDFNGDGFDDLAVGAIGDDQGTATDAGSVWIFDGFAGGIQVAASLVIDQSSVGQSSEAYDNFGFTLAAGDFDDNGYDDLAITAIGEDNDTGRVTVVYSVGGSGLSTSTAQYFNPSLLGSSAGDTGSWFGKGLAAGNLDGDSYEDLVIGAPKTAPGGVGGAGRVYVVYGSQVGLSTTDTWFWDTTMDSGWLQDTALELGWSLAVGSFRDINNATAMQIAVGAPGYESNGKNDSGAFVLLSHSDTARGPGGTLNLYPQAGVPSVNNVDVNDRFGETLAAGDFDNDGFDDLAVGAVSDNITEQVGLGPQSNSGSATLYKSDQGSSFGFADNRQLITHKTLNDHVFGGDNLGRGLAFGDFDGNGRAALAVGTPYGDYYSYEGDPTIFDAGRVYIHAPWRQPRNRPHRGSAALDCNGYLVYAQRAWQRMRPASTTKTMTLKLACDSIDQGQDPTQWITVPTWVATKVGGSSANHQPVDKLMYFDLFKTMMTVSGNDSAMLLGALMSGEGLDAWSGWSTQSPSFAAAMETQASNFGMSPSTSFTNAAGIDSGDHYTTPYDFALMTRAAIQDPCVKQIVNQNTWIVPVQRLGQNGIPGQYGFINLKYDNGFMISAKNQYSSLVGMKGGQTPGALRTGVYSAYVPLVAGYNAEAGFGVWDDGDPYPNSVADCNTCLGGELAQIATAYCNNAGLPDQITQPDPTPHPWTTLTDVSSYEGDTPMGVVFNASGDGNHLGRQIQVDVLRSNMAWPTADFETVLRHTGEVCVDSGSNESVGIAPYQKHDGFRITNHSAYTVDLQVDATDPAGYSQLFSVEPDSNVVIPATDGSAPAADFQLTVTNLTVREAACVEIEEIGYRSLISLGDGTSLPDVMTFSLTRPLGETDEVWSLEFSGKDAMTGNLLDVSAYDPSGSVGVRDGGGDLPVGPRPVASKLLPNVPNPFNPSTSIRFDLSFAGDVDLVIHDVRGRLVRTLEDGTFYPQGRHAVTWDGRDDGGRMAASGVYFVRLSAAGTTDTHRVVMLK